MKVVIKLFATLRNYGPEYQEIDVPENAILEDIIEKLDLPVKIPLLKVVNGKFAELKKPLKEGDEIALFPPIAGGLLPMNFASGLLKIPYQSYTANHPFAVIEFQKVCH